MKKKKQPAIVYPMAYNMEKEVWVIFTDNQSRQQAQAEAKG